MTSTKFFSVISLLIVSFVLAACGAGSGIGDGGTVPTDPQSAAAFLPQVSGYTVTSATSISDAISAAVGTGVDQLDNFVLEQTVSRVDAFIQCYEDVGAVAANIYTQVGLDTVLDGNTPSVGAVAIVNQDRIRENLISCVTSGGNDDFSAQSGPPTCQRSGTFSTGGDTFTYIYISNQDTFCAAVETHFAGIGN